MDLFSFFKNSFSFRKYSIRPIWKPILVGGVFNEVNKDIYIQRENPNPRKFKYSRKDMQDWAELSEVKIKWPSIFPVNAVKMMRIAIIAEEENKLVEFASLCFKSYWEDDLNVGDEGYFRKNIKKLRYGSFKNFSLNTKRNIKNKLRNNTESLIERGGFGSPTIFINDNDMYFGNDRIELIDYKLNKLTKNS